MGEASLLKEVVGAELLLAGWLAGWLLVGVVVGLGRCWSWLLSVLVVSFPWEGGRVWGLFFRFPSPGIRGVVSVSVDWSWVGYKSEPVFGVVFLMSEVWDSLI